MTPTRLSYEESCKSLQEQRWLDEGDIPPLKPVAPAYDDEVLGLSFFRTWLDGTKGADFRNLSLPRTYFSRSQISDISFENTDLSESVANWNDFVAVDFSDANLSQVDLRGNSITRTNFVRTNLTGADLRCCGFKGCDFTSAKMTNTKLTRETGSLLKLSDEQKAVIDWHDDDGDEPDGG